MSSDQPEALQGKGHYGSNPVVYAQIWEDLQQMPEALEDTWKMDPDSFLMALHFLTRYPTEHEQSGIFKICEKTARSWTWIYARKIQALKEQKVSVAGPPCLFERFDF